MTAPLPIDSQTQWGRVAARGCISGERYYWFIDKTGTVSMLPAVTVEVDLGSGGKGGG
jgi:hypothetical protein